MKDSNYTITNEERARQLIPELDVRTRTSNHKYWWGYCELPQTEEMKKLGPVIARILEREYDYTVDYIPESLYISLKCKLD